MSTTKALNYRDFLKYGGRTTAKPLGTLRVGTFGFTSIPRNQDTVAKVLIEGESPVTLVIASSGIENRIVSRKESLAGWIPHKAGDVILRSVYSAGGSTVISPLKLESSRDFELLRDKIRGFANLPAGWDSYDGAALPSQAIEAALAVVDELEGVNILPEWVVPTSDSSILMSAKKRGTLLKWEIDSDGDVAVMLKLKFSPPTYHDLATDEIGSFLQRNFPDA